MAMIRNAKQIIKNFIVYCTLFLFGLGQSSLVFAQTASLLPNAEQTFFDVNGNPLTSGTVTHYVPSTSTLKTTWRDAGQVTPNSNPLTLDSAGRAIIYGAGNYRQVVKDRSGNTIWDQVTSSASVNSSNPTLIGDGHPVGTILQWSGLTAPLNYVFAYGQELSRTTYSSLLSVITTTQAVFCTSGSAILTGLSDTTQIPLGADVEGSCTATSTVVSKTATTITLSNTAGVSTNTTVTIYPWGNGNGTTTFNVPDARGRVFAGRDNMGGTASTRLTSAYYGSNTDPNSIGQGGGAQSQTLVLTQLPIYTPTGTIAVTVQPNITSTAPAPVITVNTPGVTITDPGHTHPGGGLFDAVATNNNFTVTGAATAAVAVNNSGGESTASATTGITAALSATIVATNAVPVITSTASGGTYTFTGAVFGAGQPHTIVQPTITINYVIKILPDANISTLNVVTSLGGMIGDITCGTGLVCSSQTISASIAMSDVTGVSTYINALTADGAPSAVNDYFIMRRASDGAIVKVNPGTIASAATAGVSSLGGLTGALLLGSGLTSSGTTIAANNGCGGTRQAKTANYTLINSDMYTNIILGGSTQFTLTAAAANTYTTGYSVCIFNSDSGRGKIIALDSITNFILWPLQTITLIKNDTAWGYTSTGGDKGRWKIPGTTTFNVDPLGSDSNDCLGTTTGACLTIQATLNKACRYIDANNYRFNIAVATGAYTENIRLCDPIGTNAGGYDINLTPQIVGSTATINCGASACFTGVNSRAGWQISGFITAGTGASINSDAYSHIYVGGNTFGTTTGAGYDLIASYGGFIEVIGNLVITGNKAANIYAVGSGTQVIVIGSANIHYTATIAYSQSLVTTREGATVTLAGTYSGSTTQPGASCILASLAGGLSHGGAGLVGLPCSTTATITSPGWLY